MTGTCRRSARRCKKKENYLENGAALGQNLELRRRFTLVLPRPGIFNTTAFNNVAYGLKIRGLR